MTYSCRYNNNSTFPYSKRKIQNKTNCQSEKNSSPKEDYCENPSKENTKKEQSSFLDSSFLRTFLDPIEKLIGRKIGFDDILLVLLIYILFTEKEEDNDNKTMLLCLAFILFS